MILVGGRFPQQVEPDPTGCLHVLACGVPRSSFVAGGDGRDQLRMLGQGLVPTLSHRQSRVRRADQVGGQPLQEILEHGIVRSRPDGSVELQVRRRPGVVIRLRKCAVTFHQAFELHNVSDVVGQGRLPGRLLFQKNRTS